jgi:hypothetical protein
VGAAGYYIDIGHAQGVSQTAVYHRLARAGIASPGFRLPWWLWLTGALAGCDEDILRQVPGLASMADAGSEAVAAGAPLAGIAREETLTSNGVATADVLGQRVVELFGITDVTRQIELGQIVPGSSATSPLLAAAQSDSKPPYRGSTTGEVALLARFIDELEGDVPGCAALPFVGIDGVLEAVADDIAVLAAEDRRFARYVTLTYASNARLCGPALERQRQALFEAVNGASMGAEIIVPHAIDPGELIYRLNIRSYGWNRTIDLGDDGDLDFVDGWAAAVAEAGAYGMEYGGAQADAVKAAARTAVPLLPAHVLVHAISAGDLYYSLIGVRRSVDETQLQLGLDVVASFFDATARLAAFGSSRRETRVFRFTQGAPDSGWWAIADEDRSDGGSPFDDPIALYDGPPQFIFRLRNGLQAYVAQDDAGARLRDAPPHRYCRPLEVCDAMPLAACHGCHAAGLLPVKDEILDYVLQNEVYFDPQTFEEVQVLYAPGELDALLESDSDVHRAALARALVPADGPNALSRIYFQFDREPLTARRAAAELGVPLEVFLENLPQLDARLAPLGVENGSVDRATFSDTLRASSCLLRAGSRNRPLGCR